MMSMNHRHSLKIPVNEMSNTHHTNPQAAGPAEESAHLQQSPLLSALIQQSTFMARVGRGKNTFSEDYTTHHLLIRVSLSHPPLHFEMALAFLTLAQLCHQQLQQKRRLWQCRCTPGPGHKDSLSPHNVPTSPWGQPPLHELNPELTANMRAPNIHQRSVTPHLECLYHLKHSNFRYPAVCTGSKPP